jgi:hypothetical protein
MAKGRIFIPTEGPEDWKRFLADPDKQWRKNFSAMELANRWESCDGFPPEIIRLFHRSEIPSFQNVELLFAFPEYKVPLPGGKRPSQNDLFVLAKDKDGQLISITIEGKVSEPFGPTLEDWGTSKSDGKNERLSFITMKLGLTKELPSHIRYQLLHRTVSAVIEAERFNATNAAMIVHSFSKDSKDDQWFGDYEKFVNLFGATATNKKLIFLGQIQDINLFAGWASTSI